MRTLAVLLCLSLAAPAAAQVRQSGSVSPGHSTFWVTSGIVGDAGTSTSPNGLTTLGLTAPGTTPFCINNGPTTGAYSALCLGINPSDGHATMTVNAFGGATPLGLDFSMNGNLSSFSIGANGVPNIGAVSLNPLIVGTPPNNILTVAPGATSTAPIAFSQSGTGGMSFPALDIGNAGSVVWTDASSPRDVDIHQQWTGTSTLSGSLMLNSVLTRDAISYPTTNQYISTFDVTQQFGGTSSTGTHIALNVLSQQTAATGNFAAGGEFNAVGAFLGSVVSFNEGGTSFNNGGHSGTLFGFNPAVTMNSGATFFSEASASEFNLNIKSGASVFVKYGVGIVKEATDAVQGASGLDAAVSMSDQIGAVPWFYGVQFGNEGGQWPFDTSAVLIGSRLNSQFAAVIGAAKWDIDFLSNTTSKGLIQGPNFHVNSTGITRVGFGALKPDSAGMVITADGLQAATATIAAAGTGYGVGYVYDVNGNIWHIDSVNGSGGITGVTIFQAVQTATATTPIAMAPIPYNLGATGGSLTVAYASGTTIKIQPTSAGETVVGGTQLPALNATTGFFHFPFTNATSGSGGIPTGTPANIFGNACVWNDVTFVLNCYSASAGAWKHVSFSASAG